VISLLSRVIAQATASSVIAGAISPVPRALTSVALRYGDPLHFNPQTCRKNNNNYIHGFHHGAKHYVRAMKDKLWVSTKPSLLDTCLCFSESRISRLGQC
jgi:hypothetical protein